MQAYVLVEVDPGSAYAVASAVAPAAGVVHCAVVTGPYDVIVQVTGDDVDDVSRLVESSIRCVAGVTRTITCPVFRL